MRLKNYEIETFTNLLFNMKLKSRDSRMRTRLVRQLDEYWQSVFQAERTELISQYAKKDVNGEIVLNEDRTQAILIEESIPEFNAEFNMLMNEEYVIEENETNREMLLIVAHLILNCELEFNGNDAVMYDNWCEKFEEIIERYHTTEEIK